MSVQPPDLFFLSEGPLAGRFKVRPGFYPRSLKEILLMSRLASSKTAQIWAERIDQCEGSYVDTAQFCQSIGCSLTSLIPVETNTRFDPIHNT
jgi:hypothetical protein